MFTLGGSKHAVITGHNAKQNTLATPVAAFKRSLCRHRRAGLAVRSSADPDDLHETKLGPNVAAGIKDVKEGLQWSPATVIRNE